MATISPQRFLALRELRRFTQHDMGNLLGISGKYVGMIERGEKPVDEQSSLGLLFRVQEERGGQGLPLGWSSHEGSISPKAFEEVTGESPNEADQVNGLTRLVPVIGWAHAGEAGSYEEIPKSWQTKIPTDCNDPKAFGIWLEGDSMEPRFSEGDILIVQPSEQAHSGSLIVAKFSNDGIIFRRLEMQGERFILVALNDRYPPSTHAQEDFIWIYPVYARITLLWKNRKDSWK